MNKSMTASKCAMLDEEYWKIKLEGCKQGVWLNRSGIVKSNGSGICLDLMTNAHVDNARAKILRYTHIPTAMECLDFISYNYFE